MILSSRAWMLDVDAFHHELAGLVDPGTDLLRQLRVRDLAAQTWCSADPVERSYLEVVCTASPDDWEGTPDDRHPVEWYRVLMARHLVPTQAYGAPEVLRARLPELGLSPAEARRLATGRELQRLVAAHAPAELGALFDRHPAAVARGWLGQDDVAAAVDRLRGLDREAFRGRAELVPLVEEAYQVLESAATKPDHVFLLIAS